MTPVYSLIVGILCVWRLSHLLQAEDGPANVLFRIRRRLGASIVGQAMDCFYCLSLWAAAPFAYGLAHDWWNRVLLWLACSGGACLLERLTESRSGQGQAIIFEDTAQKEQDALLRTKSGSIPNAADTVATHTGGRNDPSAPGG